MNKNKLKDLSAGDRRDLYLHYFRLLNNFYVHISVIRRLRYLGYLYNE